MANEPGPANSISRPPTHIGQRIALVTIWSAAVVGWVLFQGSTGRSTVETAQFFVDNVRGEWWALAAFIAFYAVRPIVLFPATLLTIAGGMLFGPVAGIAATVIGANLSAMVAYWIARTLRGDRSIEPTVGSSDKQTGLIERWSERMRTESFTTVLTMRLIYLPYDLVNYGAGFLAISPWPFLAATAIGSIPGTVAFTLGGSSIDRVDEGLSGFDPWIFAASVLLFILSLGVARIVGRRQSTTAV